MKNALLRKLLLVGVTIGLLAGIAAATIPHAHEMGSAEAQENHCIFCHVKRIISAFSPVHMAIGVITTLVVSMVVLRDTIEDRNLFAYQPLQRAPPSA